MERSDSIFNAFFGLVSMNNIPYLKEGEND